MDQQLGAADLMATVTDAPPVSRGPSRRRPAPVRILGRIWRELRRMRTAVIMLLVLAAASSVGSFIPQRPVNELAVIRWKEARPGLGETFEHLGLFDVYGAAWFMALYGLILFSLVGCLVPRIRAYARVLRSTPKPGGKGTSEFQGTTTLAPERAIAAAEQALRSSRYRTGRFEGGVAGERGRLREGGSLLFHVSFLLLLLGVGAGKAWGFSGQVAIVEGDRFVDTHVAYDSIREGSLFGERHRNFALDVQEFTVTFREDGSASDFVSRVRLHQDDTLVKETDIRVNNPLVHRGVGIYQLAWGWAPRIVVKQDGKPLTDAPVVFLPRDGGWRGVVKIPQTTPEQTGLEMFFFTDLQADDKEIARNRSPLPRRPVVLFQEFRGDLGLSVPQSVYFLSKRSMKPGEAGAIPLGTTVKLPRGIEVSFPELKQYTVFQIAADPGQHLALAAAAFILVGLIPSLYSSRRRVWVRVTPAGDGSRVEVAGLAQQRKGAFEQEFGRVVRNLGRRLREESE